MLTVPFRSGILQLLYGFPFALVHLKIPYNKISANFGERAQNATRTYPIKNIQFSISPLNFHQIER